MVQCDSARLLFSLRPVYSATRTAEQCMLAANSFECNRRSFGSAAGNAVAAHVS